MKRDKIITYIVERNDIRKISALKKTTNIKIKITGEMDSKKFISYRLLFK